MAEQERYKHLLEKLIQETENSRIQSVEEMIQKMISELSGEKSYTPYN
ncbi:hypothetical protein SAMN04488072_10340 [Lentibacillus halodurans]|uniref:Uncharacterized protein n=1 Tax=Lentibacillus halodurans TaxID=237679 RepID=A0A1I0WJ90_9BACI|nr:hypothetical protein [Lentibacillus halodurans]SFA88016.1 hypothetical protein SAMN04488072_10340 [Lentibacillus halodurans]